MTILITGGAGFIGSHVAEKLVAQENVVIIDDVNDYYDPRLKKENLAAIRKAGEFSSYDDDIRDIGALESIFKKQKPEKVIHLAARAGVRASLEQPLLYFDVNVQGTLNILELCRKYKVKTLVVASSSSVYGENKKVPFSESDPLEHMISPYATSKRMVELACESYAKAFGMNITCLRFFTVYGPRGRPDMAPRKFTEKILAGKEIEMYGDGTTKRDYTFVADIVEGIVLALAKPFSFEIINLGNNKPVELRRFIGLIELETGKKAKVKRVALQKGDVPVTYADISKAKKLLGWTPKVTIEAGVKKLVEWQKEQHK
jgi:UDP-glucuronate 4-epimerase